MNLFSSKREKRLWLYALICWMVILSLLFLGHPLQQLFSNQNIQAGIFLLGMLLVTAITLIHALRQNSQRISVILSLSLLTLFCMFLLRLGLAERSHLIEYSILAILIHEALLEGQKKGEALWRAPLIAIGLTSTLGVIDELLQLWIPNRFFDLNDIFFNCFAAIFAVGSKVIVDFARYRIGNRK